MYDFYFGNEKQIESDPKKWLLGIKRMLPRWPNGIPDSEYLALFDLLDSSENKIDTKNGVLIETGSGASTIVLLYFAIKWNTKLFTWDISGNKLAYLRGVLNDTLFKHYSDKNIFNYWKYIPYDSKSKFAGIPILSELGYKVRACFFDSEHTWLNLKEELTATCHSIIDGGLVTIDDGNYNYKNINSAYINMIRAKLNLNPIKIDDNKCNSFWKKVEKFLLDEFSSVKNLEGGSYRENYKDDIFWNYYNLDRINMANLGMEKLEELDHRFDAWKVCR